ncbi:MAG: O-antigen ligase family protein, partial [Planctomycetota bacterium]
DIALGEIVKLGSAFVTIVTTALLVRKRGDFVAGALGLSIAVALLAVVALRVEAKAGVEAMEGANKNSYSMFALPAVLLAGYICLHMQNVPVIFKGVFVACTLPTLAAIFMSGNRSGYLGAVIVGGMLFWGKRGRGMILVGFIGAAVAMWVIASGATKVFDERMRQTIQGNESDDYRIAILTSCLHIGLENPIIGISPQKIGFEIGRRTSVKHHYNVIDSHNVFAHVWAASGLICFTAMIAVGWAMWTYKPRDGRPFAKKDPLRMAWSLLRILVFLWVTRGLFTRDILYNPSFNICFGLSIGLCMLAETIRDRMAKAAPPAISPPAIS